MSFLGTWPASIEPVSCRMVMRASQIANGSPFGGNEQVFDRLNDRWMCYLTLPEAYPEEAAAIEALVNSFRGQLNTANLWHFARPVPVGTLRGSLYTNASAAKGASAIQVQARRGRVNLVAYSEQAGNSAWTKFATTVTDNVGTAPDGTTTLDRVTATLAGGAIHQDHAVPGTSTCVLSWVFKKDPAAVNEIQIRASWFAGGATQFVYCVLNPQTGAFMNSGSSGAILLAAGVVDLGGGFYRGYVTGTGTDAGNTLVQTAMFVQALGYVDVWGVQLEESAELSDYQRVADASTFDQVDYAQASKTLLAGDMIGAGGLLLQVAEDVTTDANATATVSIVNRLRTAIAADAVVTWDKPTAPFRLLASSGVGYAGALSEEVTLTLAEAIT